MRKILSFSFATILATVLPLRSQDEAPGHTVHIKASIPTGGFNCGRASWPLYCYGIPLSVGGTAWLYDRYSGVPGLYGNGSGFILFNGVLDLGEATITAAVPTFKNNFLTAISVTFNGTTNDGDGGAYHGVGVFTFSYVYHQSGGGRGGGSAGYYQIMQSGNLNIIYN